MRVSRDELAKFGRAVPPPPAPIEPLLTAAEEAQLLAGSKRDDAEIKARRERVLTLLRRPVTPEGADAELIALLAAARALPLDRPDDRLLARLRLAEIGRQKDPPPEVRKLLERHKLAPGDSQAFADALLPPKRDIGEFTQGSFVAPDGI